MQWNNIIIWLNLGALKIKLISCCDWPRKRSRWSHLVRFVLPLCLRKNKTFFDAGSETLLVVDLHYENSLCWGDRLFTGYMKTIFRDNRKIFCLLNDLESDSKKIGLKKKENSNVDEFYQFILQQKNKLFDTKLKHKSYMMTWWRFCLAESNNNKVSEILKEELN